MYDYLTLTELSAFEGNVDPLDQLLISRKPLSTNAAYVSYHAAVSSFAAAISNQIAPSMRGYVTSGLGDMSSLNKADLENDRSHRLTSYIPIGNADAIETMPNYAISAIGWDKNNRISGVSAVNLADISAAALTDVSALLRNLQLDDGIHINSAVGTEGVLLATTNIGDKIYSGNTKNIISVDALTDRGGNIAKITYCGGDSVILKDNLSVQQILPGYGQDLAYCGDTIAVINNTVLKNNLSITTLTQDGQQIANINGVIIKNGSTVTDVAPIGNPIATINGTTINNGVEVNDVQTCDTAKPICKINDVQIYNNVDVEDVNDGNKGNKIATVNGVDLYNHVVITDNESEHQSYINGRRILGGIKLGEVVSKTTIGNVIAEIESPSSGFVQLRSGIQIDDVKSDILATLRQEISDLRAQHARDIDALRSELAKYVKLNSDSQQIITGPVKFNAKITGNITNADDAIHAKWS